MRSRILVGLLLLVSLTVLVGFAQEAVDPNEDGNCTMIVVGKDASVDGSVMTTHTCDGNYDPRLFVIPGGKFEPGKTVTIVKNQLHADYQQVVPLGEIPQVAETHTYFLIGYPFMNEHQIMMGEHTFGGRKEYRAAADSGAMFYIEQLQAIGLQRGKTAREVIQIMGDLADQYGYADGGECISVCDPNEGWVFEIVGPGALWKAGSGEPGAVWAAKRVPDNAVYAGANRSLIGELNLANPHYYMAGKGIFSVGEKYGFWDPKGTKPFRYWDVYGYKADNFYNTRREWRVRDFFAPSLALDPWARRYPFSVVPDKKISVADLMTIQRDSYAGTPFDLTKGLAAGPYGTPDRWPTSSSLQPKDTTGWERAIAMFRCSYTIATQSRAWLPDPIGGVLWFGEDNPATTTYVPIYCGVTDVPLSLKTLSRAQFSRESAWWAFAFVENWSNLGYSAMIKDINAQQKALEGEFLAMQPAIEAAALAMYAVDSALAVKFLTNYTADVVNRTVATQWMLADTLVSKYNDGANRTYPQEWLTAVGFCDTTKIADFKDIWYGEYQP